MIPHMIEQAYEDEIASLSGQIRHLRKMLSDQCNRIKTLSVVVDAYKARHVDPTAEERRLRLALIRIQSIAESFADHRASTIPFTNILNITTHALTRVD